MVQKRQSSMAMCLIMKFICSQVGEIKVFSLHTLERQCFWCWVEFLYSRQKQKGCEIEKVKRRKDFILLRLIFFWFAKKIQFHSLFTASGLCLFFKGFCVFGTEFSPWKLIHFYRDVYAFSAAAKAWNIFATRSKIGNKMPSKKRSSSERKMWKVLFIYFVNHKFHRLL